MTTHFLTGKKAICGFVGRSWATVEDWIIHRGFPAKLINCVWESDSELISEWRRQQINGQKKTENVTNSVNKGIKKPRRLIRVPKT